MAENEIRKYQLRILFSASSDENAQSLRDAILDSIAVVTSSGVTEHRLHKVAKL